MADPRRSFSARPRAAPRTQTLSLALAAILFLPPLAEAATFPEKVQGFFCRYVIECPQEAPPAARPVAPPAPQPAPTPVIQTITQPVIERVIETRVIAAQPQATEHLLNERLLALTNDLDARLAAIAAASVPSQRQTEATHDSIARAFESLAESLAQALTTLSLTVTETLTAATAVIQSLTATTATVTDDLTVGGTLTANILTVQGITSQGALIGPYVTATSTTATSTFAGGIAGPGDFTVLQDGRVGIGVASPLFYKLQIQGSSTVDVTSKLHNLNANGYASQMIGHDGRALYLDYYNASYSGSVTDSLFESSHATVFAGSSAAGLNIAATNATSDLKFYTGGYNPAQMRMRIDANGNVGIGTTSPTHKLTLGGLGDGNQYFGFGTVTGYPSVSGGGLELTSHFGTNPYAVAVNNAGHFQIANRATDAFLRMDTVGGVDFNGKAVINGTTGNVGIGTTSPQGKLHVSSGWSGTLPNSTADDLVVESGANTGLSILAPDANTASLAFGTPGSNLSAFVRNNHANDLFEIGTNNSGANIAFSTGAASEKMRLTSSGNLGIGTTGPGAALHIERDVFNEHLRITRQGIGFGLSQSGNVGSLTAIGSTNSFNMFGATFLTTGNVGIGTTTPEAPMHVVSTAAANAAGQEALRLSGIQSSGTIGSGPYLSFTNSNNFVSGKIGAAAEGSSSYGLTLSTTPDSANLYERLRVTGSGNVGIGTTTPGTNGWGSGKYLSIYDLNTPGTLELSSTNVANGSAAGRIVFAQQSHGVSQSASIYAYRNVGNGVLGLRFQAGGSDRVTIDTTGNVGIGTTSPGAKLEIAGGALSSDFRLSRLGAYLYTKAPSGASTAATFGVSNGSEVDILSLTAGGNVGIGASNPSYKLDVVGTIRSSYLATSNQALGVGVDGTVRSLIYNYGQPGMAGLRIVSDNTPTANQVYVARNGQAGADFVVHGSGNVGIGTTSPGYLLDVNGTGRFTSSLTVHGTGHFLSETAALRLGCTTGTCWTNANGIIEFNGTGASHGQVAYYPSIDGGAFALTDASSGFGDQGALSSSLTFENLWLNAVRAKDGSVGAPAYSFAADTNTGMFRATTDELAFSTAGTERVRVDDAGNVGIGTTSPATNLSVTGNGYFTGGVGIGVVNTVVNTLVTRSSVTVGNTGQPTLTLYLGSAGNFTMQGSGGTTILNNANTVSSDIQFQSQGANTLVIKGGGNVGIGTTSPSQKLHIGQVTDATNLVQIDSTQVGVQGILLNNPAGSQWIIGKGSSRPSTNGIGFKDEDAGTFPFWIEDNAPSNALYVKSTTGNVGIGTSTPANTLVVNSGNTGEGITITHNNATARQWKLFSGIGGVGHPNFAIADGSNIRLAINNAGNIGIGTTNPNDAKLEVKGGTVCVDTDSDDSATSCIASESDERLKTNIQALSASTSLDIINALNPVSFDWRASDPTVLAHWPSLARYAGHERSIGLIAQEVMPILPEALSLETVGDDTVQYYQLDYTKFIPHLIGAIKELGAKLSALADAVGGFAESFTSKELHAVNRLCIGATCITESDLQDLLHMRSQAAGAGAAMPTSVPESESEPAAEPAGDALTEPEEEEAEEEGDGEDADEGGAASAAPQD